MYRIIPVFICVAAVTSAPQDGVTSDITYVKQQPFDRLTDEAHQPRSPYRESRIEILPLTIPGNLENQTNFTQNITESDLEDNNRRVRSEDTTSEADTTETTEAATERDERVDELLRQTEEYETRTKAPAPRFLSKLSYFKTVDEEKSPAILTNLVERNGKRRFKSKCRCEKIWNCPKLQITVPRCPNEYFLCCF